MAEQRAQREAAALGSWWPTGRGVGELVIQLRSPPEGNSQLRCQRSTAWRTLETQLLRASQRSLGQPLPGLLATFDVLARGVTLLQLLARSVGLPRVKGQCLGKIQSKPARFSRVANVGSNSSRGGKPSVGCPGLVAGRNWALSGTEKRIETFTTGAAGVKTFGACPAGRRLAEGLWIIYSLERPLRNLFGTTTRSTAERVRTPCTLQEGAPGQPAERHLPPEPSTFNVPLVLLGHLRLFGERKESDRLSSRGFAVKLYTVTFAGGAVRLVERTVSVSTVGPAEATGPVCNQTLSELGRVAITPFLRVASGQAVASARMLMAWPRLHSVEPGPSHQRSEVWAARVRKVRWRLEPLPLRPPMNSDLNVLASWQIPYGDWRGLDRGGPSDPSTLELGYKYMAPSGKNIEDRKRAEIPVWLGAVRGTSECVGKGVRWVLSRRVEHSGEITGSGFARRGSFHKLAWFGRRCSL